MDCSRSFFSTVKQDSAHKIKHSVFDQPIEETKNANCSSDSVSRYFPFAQDRFDQQNGSSFASVPNEVIDSILNWIAVNGKDKENLKGLMNWMMSCKKHYMSGFIFIEKMFKNPLIFSNDFIKKIHDVSGVDFNFIANVRNFYDLNGADFNLIAKSNSDYTITIELKSKHLNPDALKVISIVFDNLKRNAAWQTKQTEADSFFEFKNSTENAILKWLEQSFQIREKPAWFEDESYYLDSRTDKNAVGYFRSFLIDVYPSVKNGDSVIQLRLRQRRESKEESLLSKCVFQVQEKLPSVEASLLSLILLLMAVLPCMVLVDILDFVNRAKQGGSIDGL